MRQSQKWRVLSISLEEPTTFSRKKPHKVEQLAPIGAEGDVHHKVCEIDIAVGHNL
jgi:hypothetical protein